MVFTVPSQCCLLFSTLFGLVWWIIPIGIAYVDVWRHDRASRFAPGCTSLLALQRYARSKSWLAVNVHVAVHVHG